MTLVKYISLNQINLKRHIKTVHEGERNFKCDFCEQSLIDLGALKKHIKTIHEGEKKYKCKISLHHIIRQSTSRQFMKQK